MKSFFLRSLYLILALISFSIPVTFSADDLEGFNLSDEEKQKLDQELEQFVSAFNNLSPEQMQELEELNKVLENEMKEQGLDPSNLDHVLQWAEKEAQKALKENEDTEEETETEAVIKEPVKAVEFKSTSADSDASAMLLNLVTYIAELRQKSISYPEMNKKLERFSSELNELSYFLHSLSTPELMKHLLSKDFEDLYKNLEAFYQILAKQVPLIQSKELEENDIENPYQTLGLTNQASIEEVEDAYQNLKEMFDANKIQEQLQKQKVTEQEIAKTLKQSKISFSFIQDAYDELKDPKQKAILDRKVRQEADNQTRIEKSSYEAFDAIYKVFTDKLFPILSDIKKLFEKYRPEEISKAKLYDDREKKLLAESKKPFKVIKGDSGRIKFNTKDGEYDEFYKHLSQKDRNTRTPSSYKPLFDDKSGSDFFSDRGSSDKGSDKSGKDGGKKPDAKKDEKKPDAKKDEKKDDKKDSSKGTPAKKPADKESELLGEIGILSNALEKAAKNEKKVEVERKPLSMPTRGPSENGESAQSPYEKMKIDVKDIRKDLNTYLMSDPNAIRESKDLQLKDAQPLLDFIEFAKQNEIESIATSLKKLAPGASGKIESEAVSKMLKDKVLKHKKMIEGWYNDFYPILHPSLRREHPELAAHGTVEINIHKQNIHKLGTISSSKEHIAEANGRADKAKAAFPYVLTEDLYKVREFLKGMHDSIAAIEKAIGKPEPKK